MTRLVRTSRHSAQVLCLLFLFCAAVLATAAFQVKPSQFTGRVTSMVDDGPIAGARIDVGRDTVLTDEDGRFAIRVRAGQHVVRIHATGYIGMSFVRQRVKAGQVLELEVEMIPSDPSPEEQRIIDAKLLESQQSALSADRLEQFRELGFDVSVVQDARRTVRVLMEDGTVVPMDMDEYLKGVVPHEMSVSWPQEALEAQAVAARCYASTANRYPEEGAHVCTTECSQVWLPRSSNTHYDTTDRAIEETHGIVAKYDGNVIGAFYFSHCDGQTRNSEDVWGYYHPYLRAVSCPCGFDWKLGHGVGMCQYGAKAMAEAGASYEEILRHYYTGIEVLGSSFPALSGPSLDPPDGDTTTLYTYEVSYTDRDDWPVEASLLIDGYSFPMTLVDGQPWTGARYGYSTRLEAGEHSFGFQFDDGNGHCARLPASGDFSGPSVEQRGGGLPTVTPTATPGPGESRASRWSASTALDWGRGVCDPAEGLIISEENGGAISLAPGYGQATFISAEQKMDGRFNAIGSTWQAEIPDGTGMSLDIRAREESGDWSSWHRVAVGDEGCGEAEPPFGGLVFAQGEWLQCRVTLDAPGLSGVPSVSSITLTGIDSAQGPVSPEARVRAGDARAAECPMVNRAAWGADESLMVWPPEYRTPRVFIVHHTAADTGGQDPATVVRAIYYYHAVVLGWGDIGYNYLIDQAGNVYEGRSGGDGVVGGHALRYNWGSVGLALLGDYRETDVPQDAQDALVQLIAWKGTEHLIHPQRDTFFIDTTLPSLMGHRDCLPTDCPGDHAYALLPLWRDRSVEAMGSIRPNARIDGPVHQDEVRAVVPVSVTVSAAVTRADFYLDGRLEATDVSDPFVWRWNTVGATGSHDVEVVVQAAPGLTETDSVRVTVDNSSPQGSVGAPEFVNSRSVPLWLESSGATRMQFGDGWLWEGEDLYHESWAGTLISDTQALNGMAWLGRSGLDGPGYWYGPYFCDLPLCREYQVYFRMKVPDNSVADDVALLDVVDDEGTKSYSTRAIQGLDFVASDSYEEYRLDLSYKGWHGTCLGSDPRDGLEWRTRFLSRSDLYLDRVQVFTDPQPCEDSVHYWVSSREGIHDLHVRFLDEAGNYSAVQSASVLLDMTAPEWLGYQKGVALARDPLSGIAIGTAGFQISFDGVSWPFPWITAVVSAPNGITETVAISGGLQGATHVRFRVQDRAANWSNSPAYALPATPTATPSITPSATTTITPSPSPTVATATPSATVPTATASPSPTVTRTPSAFVNLPLVVR